MTASDEDFTAVVGNLKKAQNIWDQPKRILVREGDITRVLGMFFKAVVQAVLIFWPET